MGRRIYAPLWNENVTEQNREAYLSDLRQAGVCTVFLAMDRSLLFVEHEQAWTHLSENLRFFRENGLEVGVWIQGFGFGDPIPAERTERLSHYTRLRSVGGKETTGDALCPTDPLFVQSYERLLHRVAETRPDRIMIDDDLCLSVRPGLGCFCDRHLAMLEAELGEPLAGRELPKLFFTGGPSRYRSAWLKVMRETHVAFCAMARRTVDAVSEDIRLGFASGYSSWDIEGADAIELSRLLAGKSRPFLRLTGAPYWMARGMERFPGHRLATVIELARMQQAWSQNSGIEIFAEADTYPRPRYHVPSSLIEGFDLAIAACGMDTLKYFFDYRSTYGYEQGYLRHHLYNRPLYDAIEAHFGEKRTVGVRVFETMRKVEQSCFPDEFVGDKPIMTRVFSPAATMLGMLSIPATYEGEGKCGIAFGENVRAMETLPRKLIIDLSAAEILLERGVDIGVRGQFEVPVPNREYCGEEEIELFRPQGRFAGFRLAERAETVTEFGLEGDRFVGSYRYDNGSTEFLVLAFDGYSVRQDSALLGSYLRQKTLLDFADPVIHLPHNPCVWMLVKEGGGETAVLCLNLHEDPLLDATLALRRSYDSVQLIGAEGVLEGDTLRLTAPVPPYGGFVAVLKG